MSPMLNNLDDPSQLSIKQKVDLFEKAADNKNVKPLTFYNNFGTASAPNKRSLSSTDMMTNTTSNNYTSTPLSSGFIHSYSGYKRSNPRSVSDKPASKPSSHLAFTHSNPNRVADTISRIINDNKTATSYYNSHDSRFENNNSVNFEVFNEAIKDLDTFLAKELNEIQIQKRISSNNKAPRDTLEVRNDDRIMNALQSLKGEINEIKENQKDFQEKIRKQEEFQYAKLNAKQDDFFMKFQNTKSDHSSIYNFSSDNDVKKRASYAEKKVTQHEPKPEAKVFVSNKNNNNNNIKNNNIGINYKRPSPKKATVKTEIDSPILSASGNSREERIQRLEAEIYKEETLMMKINRVLENMRNIDDRNLVDIVNIERHYLVASTRFQGALAELRKLNEGSELKHLPPFNRKGQLLIKDVTLEIKPSYFQRNMPIKNEFLLVLMKYEDKVYATKPMRIIDDVRLIRFTEKFSIPEIYMDFEMRLEIYGTTFWRKHPTIRETMLKKYGFVTFSLVDTGNKSKRFQMIEVLQSENIPIRSKVLMKISQKITTDVKYKGNIYVKLRDVWHDAYAVLNGHLLEISFKKVYNSDIIQSQETMLLDLYNVDSNSAIPVDAQRISERSYTFLLKFNHYVDVANFYLMIAAESAESFSEWVKAINKVLVLIK